MDGRGRHYTEREQAGEGTGEVGSRNSSRQKTFSDLFKVARVISGLSKSRRQLFTPSPAPFQCEPLIGSRGEINKRQRDKAVSSWGKLAMHGHFNIICVTYSSWSAVWKWALIKQHANPSECRASPGHSVLSRSLWSVQSIIAREKWRLCFKKLHHGSCQTQHETHWVHFFIFVPLRVFL